MSEADTLRALLRHHVRDRLSAALDQVLTAAMGQVLTQVLVQVLQELERALEEFEAHSGTPEEPLKNTGVQFPGLKVKQEPQQESCSVSVPWPLEPPQDKQEPTDRGRSFSDVDDCSQIQIGLVTSLKGNTCKNRPLSSKPGPDQNPDTEKDEKCFELLRSGTRGRQNLAENQKTDSDLAGQSLNKKISPNKLALKVPLIKLHRLFPKTHSKYEEIVPKDIKPTPETKVKKATWTKARKEERFMCMCLQLFTRENLKIHQTPKEGEDRPFGCPSVPLPLEMGSGKKRSYRQAFNVEGKASGMRTRGSQRKVGQRGGKEGNLRETLLNQVQTDEEEEEEVCGKSEERPDIEEQEGAPLDSGDSSDTDHSDDSSDSEDSDDAAAGDAGEVAAREAIKAGVRFPCDVCGRGFSWLPDLYRHRREHFSKPWWCPDCGRTFRRGVDLRTHHCVQTQKPYSCSVCSETFFLHIQLYTHMKQHKTARRQRK